MDFENQFTRPMIHALGSRMAILKMESVCDKLRELPGDRVPDEETKESLSDRFIKLFANESDIPNIVRETQLKFGKDTNNGVYQSDMRKLYEGTVFDLAKYITERVNLKV